MTVRQEVVQDALCCLSILLRQSGQGLTPDEMRLFLKSQGFSYTETELAIKLRGAPQCDDLPLVSTVVGFDLGDPSWEEFRCGGLVLGEVAADDTEVLAIELCDDFADLLREQDVEAAARYFKQHPAMGFAQAVAALQTRGCRWREISAGSRRAFGSAPRARL